jgi:hypothetical protein
MMAKNQEALQVENLQQFEQDKKSADIGACVMGALGRPKNYQRVHVRPLWEERYRVNIYVGDDHMSAVVAHSFFLITDGDGKIVLSKPPITRKY